MVYIFVYMMIMIYYKDYYKILESTSLSLPASLCVSLQKHLKLFYFFFFVLA